MARGRKRGGRKSKLKMVHGAAHSFGKKHGRRGKRHGKRGRK